jgi:hypothetical protein
VKLEQLLTEMPAAHRDLLEAITVHALKISEHSDKNMMNARNLALVLCPSMFYPSEPNVHTMVILSREIT